MPRTRTRSEMRGQARILADAVDSDNTTDTEANVLLNQRLAELWGKLVAVQPTRYKKTTVLTTNGQREYRLTSAQFSPLPSDLMALLGIDYIHGTDTVPLDPFDFHDRGNWHSKLSGYDAYPGAGVRFDIWGQDVDGQEAEIVFDRDPPAASSYKVHYVNACPELNGEGELFDGVNGWEDHAIFALAIDMAAREETDTTDLRMNLAKTDARIASLAGKRRIGRSQQTASVWTRRGSRHRRNWI